MSEISKVINAAQRTGLVFALFSLLLSSGCNDDDNTPDFLDLDNLTDQQLVDGTVIGLKTGLSDNLELAQEKLLNTTTINTLSELLFQPEDNDSQITSDVLGNIQSLTGLNPNLLEQVPRLIELVVSNSLVVARADNHFSLDPDETGICTQLVTDPLEHAKCELVIAQVQLEATVTERQDDAVSAAKVAVTFNSTSLLSMDFSPTSASFELHLPGLKTVFSGIAEIQAAEEPMPLPSTMLGSISFEFDQSIPDQVYMAIGAPQGIDIQDSAQPLDVSFKLPSSDRLLSATIFTNEDYAVLEASIGELEFIAFDEDDNGVFPITLKTTSKLTGTATLTDSGKTLELVNIGLKSAFLSIDNQKAFYFSVDEFDATLKENTINQPQLTFQSGLEMSVFITNERGYFSDFFENTDPDLSREFFVSVDPGTVMTQLTDSVIGLGNGGIIGGISFNGLFPIGFEYLENSCMNIESYQPVACPLFSVVDQDSDS